MKTAIVTGASGFIGSALARELLNTGVNVYAVGRNIVGMRSTINNSEAKLIYGDFNNGLDLRRDINEDVDVFYHCAFAGGFDSGALKDYDLQLLNTKYTCDAVKYAIELNVKKFVFVSSVNTVEIRSFIEDEKIFPRYTCIYGALKLVAELIGKTLAKNNNIEFCTALVAMPYGENNKANNLPNIIIKQLLNGVRPKLIEGNNLYDLVYIDDVAAGLQAIGEAGVDFRNYYVGHRRLDSFRNIISKIRDIIASDIELGFGEYPDAPSVDYSLIDLDALYRDTGFECKADFKESILKTAEWIRINLM